jgi:type II secretory pathway component PulK
MQLRLRDPGAALNINDADEVAFRQFFSLGLKLDYALSNKLTAAILDWRDPDDLPRLNGGESEEYVHDGAAMLPANHPFSTVDELRFVRGMTDEIFRLALPFICIRPNNTRINVNAAPEQVLLAIPGMNEEGAVALMRQRRAGIFPTSYGELLAMLPASTQRSIEAAGTLFRGAITFATQQVEVIATARVPGTTAHATTQIIVDRAINGAVVTWRRTE